MSGLTAGGLLSKASLPELPGPATFVCALNLPEAVRCREAARCRDAARSSEAARCMSSSLISCFKDTPCPYLKHQVFRQHAQSSPHHMVANCEQLMHGSSDNHACLSSTRDTHSFSPSMPLTVPEVTTSRTLSVRTRYLYRATHVLRSYVESIAAICKGQWLVLLQQSLHEVLARPGRRICTQSI